MRLQTRNNEKYSKNKERNEGRAIQLERQRLRYEAVRQAERLAAIYDPSGKMFNVGEVVITPDGQVKSKEAIKKAAEMRVRKEIEKTEEARVAAEKAKYREEKLKAQREGREVPPKPATLSLQPAALVYGGEQAAYNNQQMVPCKGPKLSKKQQRRLEMLKPKPVPPKPVIPEGISLPEGEEDLLALWDITDEEISRRLRAQKKQKINAGKNLRKIQKEQKKFNRAMKVRKKQAANAGVLWDPEKAKKEILGEMEKADWGDDASHSDSDSDSDSDSEAETNGKRKKTSSGDNEDSDSSSNLDSDSDSDSGSDSDSETGPKKPKKKKKKGMPQVNRPRLNLELLEQSARITKEQEEKKRNARLRRRAERRATAAQEAAKAAAAALLAKREAEEERARKSRPVSLLAEEVAGELKSSKKRKRSSEEEPEQNGKKIKSDDAELSEEAKAALKRLKRKEKKEQRRQERVAREPEALMSTNEAKAKVDSKDDKLDREIAEREAKLRAGNKDAEKQGPQYVKIAKQWNPDALLGDQERKVKFLKLLGGSKYLDKETPQEKAEREKLERKKAKKERQDARGKNAAKKERRAARKAEHAAAEKAEQIAKVQSDLEKQYDAGMKLKHEGGGHRRGLGA